MAQVKISPPWIVYYRQVEALFAEDNKVRVLYDDEKKTIKLYVDDSAKAEALGKLFTEEVKFGNVTLKIMIIPSNPITKSTPLTPSDIIDAAFYNNTAVSYIKHVEGIFSNVLHYVVFDKKVVQYYTDNLGDIHGITSTLYQDIAKELFPEAEGVFFCTDIKDSPALQVGSPLGEWP